MNILKMFLALLPPLAQAMAQDPYSWESGCLHSAGRNDQIEVGGPLAGVEFHGSRPLPARISLYAPVANSIDLSTDYWQRGNSRPVRFAIGVDAGPLRAIGNEPWEYCLSPHMVRFERKDADLRYTITYEFGVRDVATAVIVEIANEGTTPHSVEFSASFALVLRSCQTYDRILPTRERVDQQRGAVLAEFNDPRLARPALVIQNVMGSPSAISIDRQATWVTDSLPTPASTFVYKFPLPPHGSHKVVHLLGSSPQKNAPDCVGRLAKGWEKETRDFARQVNAAQYSDAVFRSGDSWTDSAVSFSRGLLAANRHWLNGTVVPMPCPAEYNFFFTHDVLLTDLSAIMFDAGRVKRDLLYLCTLAKNNELPHAYYWKDDGFKTEFCDTGNWNNLWIVLATAAYYRHTFDGQTAGRVHPLLTRALEKTLTLRHGNVLHGSQPDWWDFGKAPGARAYLTILTIRALEEYVYLSSCLHKDLSRLPLYEQTVRQLRTGLIMELWDESASYLLNSTPAGRDSHIYMGALLASVYDLLPGDKAARLVQTSRARLLDPAVGIRTVFPADFHTEAVKKFYGVKSNEAGDPFLYANGGIWYLGNAWYAWAVRSVGEIEGAFEFYRRTMTLDGILRSPRGQPALYEYRYADTTAQEHGRVDKPSMMWSAGFCTGTAYRMSGIQDNVWNITVAGEAPQALQNVRAPLVYGGMKSLVRSGKGSMLTRLLVDGKDIPSRILPRDAGSGKAIEVQMGPIRYPFLDSTNSVLESAHLDPQSRTMSIALSSYAGHPTTVKVFTPWLARSVSINNIPWTGWKVHSTRVGTLYVLVDFEASQGIDTLQIIF